MQRVIARITSNIPILIFTWNPFIITFPSYIIQSVSIIRKRPNGLRLSRFAGCAGLGSSIYQKPQRTYQRRPLSEGQFGSNRGLGVILLYKYFSIQVIITKLFFVSIIILHLLIAFTIFSFHLALSHAIICLLQFH